MSYIWVSDLHVKPASYYRKTLLTGDSFYAIDQIQKFALEKEVSSLIIGGDTYDTNAPSGEATNRIAEFIRVLMENGTTVHYIEGNHDRVHKNPYLPNEFYAEHRLLSSLGAMPLDGAATLIDGVIFRGIDYCKRDKLLARLEGLGKCDVLCLHAGFRHMLGFEGAFELTKDDIPDTVGKMVLVGHIHVNNSSSTANDVMIHSSGSTWVWRIDEADKDHGFLYFEDNPFQPEYISLDTRKYFDITCEQDILDTLEEDHKLPPVLRYTRESMPDLNSDKYPGVKLIPISADADVEDVLDTMEEPSADLKDALVVGVPASEFPKEHSFLLGLLESPDPEEYVQQQLVDAGALMKHK